MVKPDFEYDHQDVELADDFLESDHFAQALHRYTTEKHLSAVQTGYLKAFIMTAVNLGELLAKGKANCIGGRLYPNFGNGQLT